MVSHAITLQVLKTPRRLKEAANDLVRVAQDHGCEGFVVGLPVTREGSLDRPDSDSKQGQACRGFAYSLMKVADSNGMTVFLIDEGYTTMQAREELFEMGERGLGRVRSLP
jgi:RNase H-fold protein (predicted Holliday junction resolvase)